jgi:hypothetical protein
LHSVVHKSTPHLSTSTLWPSDTPNPPTITPIPPTYTPSPPTSTPIFPTAVILNTCSKIPVYNLENLTVHQVIEIMQWIPENVLKVFWKEGELTFLSRVDNTGDGKIDRSDVFYQQPPNSLIFLRILDLEKYSEEALHRSVADDNFLTWLKDPFGQGYNRAWYDEVCGDVQGSNLPAVAASPLQTITYHVSLNALAMLGAIVYSNPYVRIAMLGINQYHISKPYIYTKMKNIYNKITNFIRKSPKIELNPQLEHLLFHKMQLSRYN